MSEAKRQKRQQPKDDATTTSTTTKETTTKNKSKQKKSPVSVIDTAVSSSSDVGASGQVVESKEGRDFQKKENSVVETNGNNENEKDKEQKGDNKTKNNNKGERFNLSILKHKKSIRQMEAERREKRIKDRAQRKESKAPPRLRVIPAERFVKQYRQKYSQIRRMKVFESTKSLETQTIEYPLCLVIRIRGKRGESTKISKLLTKYHLTSLYRAVILKMTPQVIFDLKLIRPFVTYGCPSYKTISDLIIKRGYTDISGSRVPLTDNTIIENALGDLNIVCIEDIIHQITTCGPAFDRVLNFLAPFKLAQPKDGFTKTNIPFEKGGTSGERKSDINQILQKMI